MIHTEKPNIASKLNLLVIIKTRTVGRLERKRELTNRRMYLFYCDETFKFILLTLFTSLIYATFHY